MDLFRFSIKPINAQTPPPREVKIKVPEGETSFATMVSIDHSENPGLGEPRHEWKETEIRFHADDNQFLYIALASFKDNSNKPRFYIRNLHTDGPKQAIHYIHDQTWEAFNGGYFPEGTLMIRIEFKMPRTAADDKLTLFVYDTVAGKEFNVDPLVGNDPP
jgi:hypothetical protein